MPITSRLLAKPHNRHVVVPAWATLSDWLDIMAIKPLATPLIDFGQNAPLIRVGVTSLNWFLMDMLGLRGVWYDDGWQRRDEVWLLINPLRYRILGHQPKRPYAFDVRDYIAKLAPQLLNETLFQHAYFAEAPTVNRQDVDDSEAEKMAAQAPWNRVAVLDNDHHIVGMVWAPGQIAGGLPPIIKPPYSKGGVTYLT